MAALDVDDILRAQSSDSEVDEDEEKGKLDSEALDRRLEELLNAEEDDDEDILPGSSSPSAAFTTHRSKVATDLLGGALSKLHSSKDDASSSRDENQESVKDFEAFESHKDRSIIASRQTFSSSSIISNDDDESTIRFNVDSAVSSQQDSLSEDKRLSTEEFMEDLSRFQRDAKFADSSHPGSRHLNNEGISSKLWSLPNMQAPGSLSSPNMGSTSSSVGLLDKRTIITAPASSSEAKTSESSDFMSKQMEIYEVVGRDEDSFWKDSLNAGSVDRAPFVSAKIVQQNVALVEENTDNFEEVSDIKLSNLTSNESLSVFQAQNVEIHNDTFNILDDNTESNDFDVESLSSLDSVHVMSDDGSEQEEINTILSKELFASEIDVTSPTHSSASESRPSGVAIPKENLAEQQSHELAEAEEVEKKAALACFGIEEGAASQPMRLQEVQKEPPNIGYVRLHTLNSVSQILSLATTTREHGIAQAITMHRHHIAVGLSKGSVLLLLLKGNDAAEKPLFLTGSDKSHASVTALSFNMQGDLLLVGHANGFLALWELSSKGVSSRPINVEHTAALLHTSFLYTRSQKAITADCKGLVLLHSISSSTFGGYSVTSQCLVDGQNTGRVLCVSPLSLDFGMENPGDASSVLQSSSTVPTSTALTSIVGGMVRGVVAGKASDHGKRHIHDGGIADEAGNMVVFVTHQSIFVFRMPPMLEKCAVLARPEGIRDGAIPYIAWRRLRIKATTRSSAYSRNQASLAEPTTDLFQRPEEEGENSSHLLLVLGWDRKVLILHLLKGELKILGSWDMDTVICGVTWLDEQIVAIVTLKEELCLFTKEGLEVQCVAIESDDTKRSSELAYHTHMLNNFGNPEKTYFSSLTTWAGTMHLLGPQRIYKAQLLPWQDQLRALQDAGDWMGAFHVGMELFDGRAVAIVGLPREVDELQKIVTPTLLNLLSNYIDEVFTYLSLAFGPTIDLTATEKEELRVQVKEQYARVGGVAIEFCVHIHQTDVLFNHIFHKFCAAGQRGTFLELLEPYILKDTLGALAPEVMQALVEYYSQMGWVQRVELCVLHMDIASLDFNQVVKLCRENRLYSALIYLFNKGLDDYKAPLEELLIVVQDVSNPHVKACGYKLLVYLKYCFLGLAFPPGHGTIAVARLPELRRELLQCLLDNRSLKNDEKLLVFQSIIHPRLSCLLAFDLKATLEVLQHAFPDHGPLSIGQEFFNKNLSAEESELITEKKKGLQLLQQTIDALADILERIHLHNANAGSMSPMEIDAWRLCMAKIDAGDIMEFIAHFTASQKAKISRVVLSRILDYLVTADQRTKAVEARRKENIMVEVLNGVPDSEWSSAHVLELALQAHYWQASACLLAKKGDLVAALDSYMKDIEQPDNGFLFILDVLSPEKQLSKDTLAEFRSSVLARLPELLQLSSEATLVILLKHFSKEHKAILLDLAPYPPLLFQYLRQIMNARLGYKSSLQSLQSVASLSDGGSQALDQNIKDKSADFSFGKENLSELLKNAGLDFSNDMEELYVELLCQFEPKSVLMFLKSFEDYRLEHCLKLCQAYGIDDAAAYLLERVGDVSSALSLVLANMDYLMRDMDTSIARLYAQRVNTSSEVLYNVERALNIPEVAAACSVMRAGVALCQRNTWRINSAESEALWFCLLDRFVDPLRRLHEARKFLRKPLRTGGLMSHKESEGSHKWKVATGSRRAVDLMQKVLVYMIGEIINGMMGYIPLSIIMDKLLSNNGKHEFGDFKGTILQMLGLYGYETTILSTAKQVVEDDMFHKLSIYKRRATRGFAPCSSTCCICKQGLHGSETGNGGKLVPSSNRRGKSPFISVQHLPSSSHTKFVMIFPCGHAAHSSCAVPEINMAKSKPDFVNCPCCLPKTRRTNLPNERMPSKLF